jgi:hypothetical protein
MIMVFSKSKVKPRTAALPASLARPISAGDVILNKPFWSHGLENNSTEVLKILVFEVKWKF